MGTTTILDRIGLGNVVREFDSLGNSVALYDYGLGLLSEKVGLNKVSYYTFDAMGSVQEITADSEVLNSYRYSPDGKALMPTKTVPNVFEFLGEFGAKVDSCGLHMLRARFYDSKLGRWLSQDPIGQAGGINLYSYCFNNPVNLVDPQGLDIWLEGASKDEIAFHQSISIGDPNGAYSSYSFAWSGENGILDGEVYSDPFHGGKIEKYKKTTPEQDKLFKDKLDQELELGQKRLYVIDDICRTYSQRKFDEAPGTIIRPSGDKQWIPDFSDLDWLKSLTKILVPIFAASGDPNEKRLLAGFGQQSFVQGSALLPYHIAFENESTASSPAQEIIVTDRLSPSLDWRSFELTEVGFGDVRIQLPPGSQHFETNLPVIINGDSFTVYIQGGIHLDTGEVSWTFRALDPLRELPPPLQTGILPPENGTGRGQGFVSYLVRLKLGLPTGTEIRNVALISFDRREIIATDQVAPHDPSQGIDPKKQALVTIDAGAPSSRVAALPSESGRVFEVQWSGADDTRGSGLASYDVFVATNGAPFVPWLSNVQITSSLFFGELGKSYAFYTLSRDNVGNVELSPAAPDANTLVLTNAPLIVGVTNQVSDVGGTLVISNQVQGASSDQFRWALAEAPSGAVINPTNGVLRWTPNCSQASRSHSITVLASLASKTNVFDLHTFVVSVNECVVPGLGRIVLAAGDSGRLPVNLISTVPITNLAMTVETETNRILSLSLESIVPEICSTQVTPAPNLGASAAGFGFHMLSLGACSNQFLVGTQQIAWLHFTTASNQSSAFVSLNLDNAVGRKSDGSEVRNFAPQSGRVVIVGQEPLLEALMDTNLQPTLIFYGQPGPGYLIESKPQLLSESPWEIEWRGDQTNLFQRLPVRMESSRFKFIRARREPVAIP